jgi:transmembrane sensor
MDDLIIRSFKGDASEAEERELHAWRSATAQNDAYYRDMIRLLEATETVILDRAVPVRPPGADLVRAADRRPIPLSKPRSLRGFGGWMAGGGLLAAAAAAAVLLWVGPLNRDASEPEFSLGTGEFVTSVGETATITLADGSIVRLAPQTRLRLTGKAGREVWLEGRAYFAVAKREGARFRVRTQAGDAVVLGTRFDLQARGSDLRVLVVEGEVEVAAQGETAAVTANQMARAGRGAGPVSEPVDSTVVQQELKWMGDFLVFAATPLDQVAQELSVRYSIPVTVMDSALATETVHVWFSGQDLEDVLRVVCRTVNANCTVHPHGVTIAP